LQAFFKVEIVKIDDILPHPDPETHSLELAQIKGWQCVVAKGRYSKGDKVVYIPIDSILPKDVEEKLFPPDSKIKLNKSRVRTIKIRKAVSQGMIASCELLGVDKYPVGKDVKDILGITKHEPPVKHFNQKMNVSAKKRINNPNFRKYGGIENFKNYNDLFEDGEEVIVSEKVHGCLQAYTKISLFDGSQKTIKEIVDNKLDVDLIGFYANGQIVPTKIFNWFNNGKTKTWKKVKFSRIGIHGNNFGSIICTENHKFYIPQKDKYIACSKLNVGDKILFKRDKLVLDYLRKQMLIGKMLGDGCLNRKSGHIDFSHKKEHEEYLDFNLKLFGYLAGVKQKEQISGYGTTMCRARTISSPAINELLEDWYLPNVNKKIVPRSIIDNLGPLSIAIWYMDDGSLSHNENQIDRASIATCRYSSGCVDNLVNALKKFGIDAIKYNDGKYYRLRINSDSSDILFNIISPYVPKCMQYKLPESYRGLNVDNISMYGEKIYKADFIEQKIISIEDVKDCSKMNTNRYDLETGTHNFVANGVLVHNSNYRAGIVKYHKYHWWEHILGLLNHIPFLKRFSMPEWENVYGSNNVQLQKRFFYSGFYKENVYGQITKQYDVFNKLKPGEVIYGEIYGCGIQKNYTYGCKGNEIKLVIFDVMIDGEFLSQNDAIEWAKERGFDFVPILYRGPFNHEHIKLLTKGNSVLCPSQKIREGVVIKPLKEAKCYMGRKVLKLISDQYLLKDNTDFH
jgi:intein/homing endonuclease